MHRKKCILFKKSQEYLLIDFYYKDFNKIQYFLIEGEREIFLKVTFMPHLIFSFLEKIEETK